MGVMGFTANASDSNAPKSQRTRSSANPTTPAARIPQSISDDEEDTQLSQSCESINSNLNGPTPKRPSGNHKSHAPDDSSAAGPKTRSPPPTSRISRSVRKPLAEADRNSPTKSQRSSASKRTQVQDSFQESQAQENLEDNRPQHLDLDMDLEFSRDFIFSSTDFTRSIDQIAPQ